MKVNSFCASILCATMASTVVADTDKVQLPENYTSTYVRYDSVDKPAGRGPEKTRFFYVNPESLAAAVPGRPLPVGTVLIMEDHKIEVDDSGKPVRDRAGRFIPTHEVTNIFVQEKGASWGAEYPDEVSNGEWEYAWFLADGRRRSDAKLDGCLTCHKGVAEQDFTFTFWPFVQTMK